jgi:hypothetical protein
MLLTICVRVMLSNRLKAFSFWIGSGPISGRKPAGSIAEFCRLKGCAAAAPCPKGDDVEAGPKGLSEERVAPVWRNEQSIGVKAGSATAATADALQQAKILVNSAAPHNPPKGDCGALLSSARLLPSPNSVVYLSKMSVFPRNSLRSLLINLFTVLALSLNGSA